MMGKALATTAAIAVIAAACTAHPVAPEFVETTTTTTTLPGGPAATTTTATLPPPEERETGTVVSVTDGDTLVMSIGGTNVDVRLDGINAPELDECWGPEATSLLARLVDGQELVLATGDANVDQFGRLLRYAYLETPEETIFVNARLVRDGNAIAVHNGSEFVSEFKGLEARAYQSGRGMWGTTVCGDDEVILRDRPVVRVHDIQFDPPGPDDDAMDSEYVTFVNEGYGRVSFAGWTLRDESSSHRLTFPRDTVLAPGDTVTVVTGCDGGPSNAIHWCNDTPVWSNGGDTVIVSDSVGNAVIWFTYDAE